MDSARGVLVLDPEVNDPIDVAFGFGRRICPGRYMAYESMWMTMTSVLAVFNIEPTRDAKGNPILPPEIYSGGFVKYVFLQLNLVI